MNLVRHRWQLLGLWLKNDPTLPSSHSRSNAWATRTGGQPRARDRHPDSGFTLVEVLVATMLMGVGIVGAASLFSLSSRASAAAEHRTQASHVIVSEMETIQALPYSKVGLNPSAKGFQRAYEGRETVVWTKSSAATPDPVSPYSVRVVNGTRYTIIRNITWADSGTDAYLVKKSYKVLNIKVQWVDSSGTHTIQQESGVYQEVGTEISQAGGR